MREAISTVLRRLAAYAIYIATLAVLLISFSGLQLALLWVVYALFALYLFVVLRNEGRRSARDFVAGAVVLGRRA